MRFRIPDSPSHPPPIPSPVSPGRLVAAKIKTSLHADTENVHRGLLLPAHPTGKAGK